MLRCRRMQPRTSRVVALCSAANLINAADRVLMPIAIIPMTDEFSWSLHVQGWVLSSFACGYFTSQLLGANAAVRHGGKRVLAGAVLLWSISTLATPLAAYWHPMAVILLRILLGIGEGLGLPTIFHIFSYSVSVEQRSRAFAYLVALGSVGQTLAAILCPHLPWPWMFYVFGSLGLIWVIFWQFLFTDIVLPPEAEYSPLSRGKSASTSGLRKWLEFLRYWPLWAIYIAHFCMNWSNYIILQWLPTYLTRRLGAQPLDISFTALPYIINSLCGMVAGHFADNLVISQWSVLSVRRLMTAIGLIGPAIFLLCFSAVNALWFAVVLISLSMGLCACNSAGHLSNHADIAPHHAGITFAISNTIATIPGILCGPLTAELVTQSDGRWFPVFVLAASFNFVGAIIYIGQSAATPVL